jgi:hypothetical protein
MTDIPQYPVPLLRRSCRGCNYSFDMPADIFYCPSCSSERLDASFHFSQYKLRDDEKEWLKQQGDGNWLPIIDEFGRETTCEDLRRRYIRELRMRYRKHWQHQAA